MNVLIIEDEKPAAEKLERLLLKYDDSIVIQANLASVKAAVNWLEEKEDILDLIFMDIQLTDGLSFEIFKQIEIQKPIIFTTAFDEYALEAFRVNSIDYLLKPISFQSLSDSMKKLENIRHELSRREEVQSPSLEKLLEAFNQPKYTERFLVKLGDHIHSISTNQVICFYAEGRNTFLITTGQRKYILDHKLESLEEMLDPKVFFRVSRSFILHIERITDVMIYSNSRLRVFVDYDLDREIIVSREKVQAFKKWFGGM
ncbi:LytTR family DNA-binding domain-containing protein [Rapidithrix thailandica]|uniref:LytTR family DNA-binding domain-containing protein n=1 Tax=Rapidithrix thailandica TaxID=413964 RepID=A0AAW9SB60_9BACT